MIKPRNRFSRLLLPVLGIAALLLTPAAFAQVAANLSSRFLARGETAVLEISSAAGRPDIPAIPSMPEVKITPLRAISNRRGDFAYAFLLESYKVGDHVLPSIEMEINGIKASTEPLRFTVFDPNELEWSRVNTDAGEIRYASIFRASRTKPYEGEALHTEMKIYIPRTLAPAVEDWGIPEFKIDGKMDGIASWRFEPGEITGQVNLLGTPYVSRSYPSSMTATRPGKVSIGPASLRLTAGQTVPDFSRQSVYMELFLNIPKLELDAARLPEGAPEGFSNAIGKFSIESSVSQTEVHEGDPVSVELSVFGSGNLDTLRAPKPVDEEGWKLYEATQRQRGDERRELSGKVIFDQFMRPLAARSMIPPFKLVYFDPAEERYKTVVAPAIPLKVLPSTTPSVPGIASEVPSLAMPIERMTDVLGIARNTPILARAPVALPGWLGHAIAGLAALALITRASWMRVAPRLRKDPVREIRLRDLQAVANAKSDDPDFLKAAGRFIEKWLRTRAGEPEFSAVLAERDDICFRPERTGTGLPPKRRDEILKLLRKTALALVLACSLGLAASPARAAEAPEAESAYAAAKYEDAVKLWLDAGPFEALSADTLYNIGNACYRMGSPGNAALYYRRALARNPSHAEARQNLRFIERKHGSITIEHPAFKYTIARVPLAYWQAAAWTGAWTIVLALLVFPATRPGARMRIAAGCLLVAAPILAGLGASGWYLFPDDAKFAPLVRQAVITSDNTVAHSDAARTSPQVIDAPPGSLCEILRVSGRWVYVAFASDTRGWVPSETIEKLIPDSKPVPPKVIKPKADASSA